MQANVRVLNPVGYPPEVVGKSLAPRRPTLESATIYLVDCRFVNSDVFLEQMRLWFADNLPNVRTPVVRWSGTDQGADEAVLDEIEAKGDAAILGVGI